MFAFNHNRWPFSRDLKKIYPTSAQVNVSTLTTLLAFTKLEQYSTLLFALINDDATNPVTFIIDTSEDGVAEDPEHETQIDIAAGKQGSLEIGPSQTRAYFALSAHSAAPSYPMVKVRWLVKGIVG